MITDVDDEDQYQGATVTYDTNVFTDNVRTTYVIFPYTFNQSINQTNKQTILDGLSSRTTARSTGDSQLISSK